MSSHIWTFVFGGGGDTRGVPQTEEFRIKYGGPAFDAHSIDINDLAPALLALNDLIKEANFIANDDTETVTVKVRATSPGSFEILIQAIQSPAAQAAIKALNSSEATALANLMTFLGVGGLSGGLIWLVTKLKGKQPEKVTEVNSDEFEIETKEGTLRIGKLVWQFYNSRQIRKSVYGVLKPLEKPGVEGVEFIDSQNRVTVVDKEDAKFFVPPEENKEKILELPPRETYVNVVHMWLKGGHKWKFSEGGASEWTAEITHADFINRLLAGDVRVGAHDFLKVRVKQTQFIQGSDITSTYEIIEVLEHKKGGDQLRLL